VIFLIDTSVAIKWVHEEGEAEVDEARQLLAAHRAGTARLLLLDLAAYEFGNVLLRPLRQPPSVVIEQLDLLRRLCGPFVHPTPSWLTDAAVLSEQHGLTFYDACWAAAARALACPLVSADRKLVSEGLAISPATAAADIH
jgi:predicted nucleic acid-binding protein